MNQNIPIRSCLCTHEHVLANRNLANRNLADRNFANRRAYLHALCGHVQRHKGDEALRQQLRDDLADAAEAGDDDVVPQLPGVLLRRLQRLQVAERPLSAHVCFVKGAEGRKRMLA